MIDIGVLPARMVRPLIGPVVVAELIVGPQVITTQGGSLGELAPARHNRAIASYVVNERAVARARQLIESRQYVLDSDWGDVQPAADLENAYLNSHTWEEYAEWHLGLREGAREHTKARYGFVYGDLRRVHRSGVIACLYRAAEWRHKQVERTAYDLLQFLDERSG